MENTEYQHIRSLERAHPRRIHPLFWIGGLAIATVFVGNCGGAFYLRDQGVSETRIQKRIEEQENSPMKYLFADNFVAQLGRDLAYHAAKNEK